MPTKIMRQLTIDERHDLQDELIINESLWTSHSSDLPTSLADGKSIHLNMIQNDLKYVKDLWKLFPKTYNIIKTVSQDKTIGRCYWHRLLPNDIIGHHTDNSVEFVKNDQLYARYQIYLECPEDQKFKMLIVDAKPCNPKKYEYSLLDFDLRLRHRYNNLSDNPWYFLVFDVLKSDIKLH